MRLLILTQYYPPETGAPQARLSELAVRLRDRGHTITVLTAMPNYPIGKVFSGYRRRFKMEEKIDGVRIIRTWIWPSKSRKALPRLISYASFVLSSVLLGLWRVGRQDVVLFESPPLFIVPAGLIIGRACGARIVMNCSDLWPGTMVRSGYKTGGPLLKTLFWLEKFGYEHSNVVAVTNPTAAKQVTDRYPHVRTTIISNGVDTTFFRPDLRSDEVRAQFGAAEGDFLVGYCGLHGISQGMDVIIGAAEKLKSRRDIRFILVGDGPCKELLVSAAVRRNLDNVAFHAPRPKKEIPPILASCDVSLIPLVSRMEGTMPSKFYEAIASGTPALVAEGCEADPLTRKYNVGRVFGPLNDDQLAAAIAELADNPQEMKEIRANCLELAKRFDRDVIAERTNSILEAIAAGTALPEVIW